MFVVAGLRLFLREPMTLQQQESLWLVGDGGGATPLSHLHIRENAAAKGLREKMAAMSKIQLLFPELHFGFLLNLV